MKLAFCLYKFFPFGGLQRDFLKIAHACQQRGHSIDVYTMQWEGQPEPSFTIHTLGAKGWQNHTRNRLFADHLATALKSNTPDLVIGFNKLPNLDVYYAADVCYQARIHTQRLAVSRWLPRYHQHVALEQSVFGKGNKTEILLIAPQQQHEYMQYYQTETQRFHLLPPGISKDRIAPSNAADIRSVIRKELELARDQFMLLMVGSGFKTKGLDRAIKALAHLPPALRERCQLFVIGQGNPKPFARIARRYRVDKQIQFLGGRGDVPNFLLAADVLLHPSYHENTGTVILEAVAAGLPVLTHDGCGYAHYVREANAGIVLSSTFSQASLNASLETMLTSRLHALWRQNGMTYAKQADIFSLPERAAEWIEIIGQKRERISS